MRRWIANILCTSSMAMLAATIFLWVRSCAREDYLVFGPESGGDVLVSTGGAIALYRYDWIYRDGRVVITASPRPTWIVPHFAIALLLAAPPAVWVAMRRRRPVLRRGFAVTVEKRDHSVGSAEQPRWAVPVERNA